MWRWADVREDVDMSRCEDEQMWEKMWTWADVKMSRCEDEQMWEKMWTWADVKMSRCERRCEDEQMWEKMWRWADVKMRRCCWEDVKMSRCERRCEDEQMWRWEDVEKMWRWADVKMSRCERRCEDEQMWRWEDVKMRRCWEEDVKMRRCFTDPHYWKNPALRRSREKNNFSELEKLIFCKASIFFKLLKETIFSNISGPQVYPHIDFVLIGSSPSMREKKSSLKNCFCAKPYFIP